MIWWQRPGFVVRRGSVKCDIDDLRGIVGIGLQLGTSRRPHESLEYLEPASPVALSCLQKAYARFTFDVVIDPRVGQVDIIDHLRLEVL